MPFEIFEEVKDGPADEEKDLLFAWLQDPKHKQALLLEEEADPALVQQVVAKGYAPDLTDDEVEQLGRDPFLVAYALAAPDRCVVTAETSAPGKKRHKRKLPDVCKTFGQAWCGQFQLNRNLGFTTRWKRP